MNFPTQARVTEERRQALLSATAREHQILSVTRPTRSIAPQPVRRVRTKLRYAVTSFFALL